MSIDPEVKSWLASEEGKRAVAEKTAAINQAAEINRRGDALYDQALKEFGQEKIDKALKNFEVFDGLKLELAEALFDGGPDAHKVLFEIGSNPDLIDRLYKMTPAKMTAEVARMTERAAAASKKAAPGARGGDTAGADWTDPEKSMADFVKGREADLAAKRKAQRGGVRVY